MCSKCIWKCRHNNISAPPVSQRSNASLYRLPDRYNQYIIIIIRIMYQHQWCVWVNTYHSLIMTQMIKGEIKLFSFTSSTWGRHFLIFSMPCIIVPLDGNLRWITAETFCVCCVSYSTYKTLAILHMNENTHYSHTLCVLVRFDSKRLLI